MAGKGTRLYRMGLATARWARDTKVDYYTFKIYKVNRKVEL